MKMSTFFIKFVFVIVSVQLVSPVPIPSPTPRNPTGIIPPWGGVLFQPRTGPPRGLPPTTRHPSGIVPPWGGVVFQPRENPSGTVPPFGRVDYTPAGPAPPGLRPLRPPPPPSGGSFEFVAAPPPPVDEDLPRTTGLGTCFRPFVAAADPSRLTFLDLMNAVDGGPKDEGAPAVEYTLKQGIDPNQMPYDLRTGESVLLHAVFCNKEKIVKLLLEHGADPNQAKASDGITPLHYAAWRDNVNMMKALVEKGAKVTAVDHQGHTVFQRALCMHAMRATEYISTLVGPQLCTNNPSQSAYWANGSGADMCYRLHRYYEHDIHG